MKELLLYMAKNLVDNPDQVTVTEIDDEDGKVQMQLFAPGGLSKAPADDYPLYENNNYYEKLLSQIPFLKICLIDTMITYQPNCY